MKKIITIALLALFTLLAGGKLFACGHEGFYMGLGYNQLFLYTTAQQNIPNPTTPPSKVHFSPGYGANVLIGYDFKNTRFGIQMPFEFSRIKLNRNEWVNNYTHSLEGIIHIASWENGFDIRFVAGAGWTYVDEGHIQNNSSNFGIVAGGGPSLAYYFTRSKITAALVLEAPVRYAYFFGSHLSKNGMWALDVPIRLGLQVGFP